MVELVHHKDMKTETDTGLVEVEWEAGNEACSAENWRRQVGKYVGVLHNSLVRRVPLEAYVLGRSKAEPAEMQYMVLAMALKKAAAVAGSVHKRKVGPLEWKLHDEHEMVVVAAVAAEVERD